MASDRIQRRIERLFDQIEQEADQQNWQLVRDLSDEVLRLDPDNGDALAFLSAAERNRDVIRSYQEVCAGAVACFEGYIAQIPREERGSQSTLAILKSMKTILNGGLTTMSWLKN